MAGMILVHLIYDLTEVYPVLTLRNPAVFSFFKERGGTAFFLISGISAVLGSRHLRRGLAVLGCAVAVSAVTALWGDPVRFGVLHCLGLCMLSWALFRRAASPALAGFGLLFALLGEIIAGKTVSPSFLYPLGLVSPGFTSADFFPLLPYLGYFLLGAVLGRKLYRNRRSLLPNCSFSGPVSRFFRFCGRHALELYLIHQPVLILLIEAGCSLGGIFREY